MLNSITVDAIQDKIPYVVPLGTSIKIMNLHSRVTDDSDSFIEA